MIKVLLATDGTVLELYFLPHNIALTKQKAG